MTTTTTKIELWKQAVQELETAVAALDQAHAMLKDLGLEYEIPLNRQPMAGRPAMYVHRPMNVEQIVNSLDGLLGAIQHAECEECGHEIREHHDYCEYERGGDVETGHGLVARPPCGCEAHRKVA